MDKVVKILEVNNIDLIGKSFNGMDLKDFLNKDKRISAKMAVIYKMSSDKNVLPILDDKLIKFFETLSFQEEEILSIHSNISLSSPMLKKMNFYKECDIIHFHQFHNTRLSLYSLLEIQKTKKIVLTLHDPWFFSGRCVHSYDCEKWENGCYDCPNLNTLFPMKIDNTKSMWNLKKNVMKLIDCDIIVTSQYMFKLAKKSQIMKDKRIHLIPLGVDIDAFSPIKDNLPLRKQMKISKNEFVFFTRAQLEFKGSKYLLEALKKIKKEVTLITCDQKGIFSNLPKNIRVIDLGIINQKTMIDTYRICDVFLMPSKSESFGVTAIEAMSCGKPVIIFDNTALPYVTNAPDCGILVENENVDKLADALDWIIENPSEIDRRGLLGRKIVERNFNIKDTNNMIKELYLNINKKPLNVEKKSYSNYYKNSNDISILISKLRKINKNMGIINKNFVFLRTRMIPRFKTKHLIDYSDFNVQELLQKYNEELIKKEYKIKTNKIKTACRLLIKNPRKFIEVIVDKIKR